VRDVAGNPKRMAAAVLALRPSGVGQSAEAGDDDDDDALGETGEAALEAASEELIAAVEAKDPRAVMAALRAAYRSM